MGDQHRKTFREPRSILEAKERRAKLIRDAHDIDVQFPGRGKRGKDGKPMSREAWLRWRKSAKAKKVWIEDEKAFLKEWIARRRASLAADVPDVYADDTPQHLLRRAHLVLRKALRGEAQDADLGSTYNALDQYLNHAG
jgi:hypothetical protein